MLLKEEKPMKNLAKILVLALLVASVMTFAACSDEDFFNIEGMGSIRAMVIEAPDGATGVVWFEPFEEYYQKTGSPLRASVNVDNVFFAADDIVSDYERYGRPSGRVTRASGLDLIPDTIITVYYESLLLSFPVQFEDIIIVIDRN